MDLINRSTTQIASSSPNTASTRAQIKFFSHLSASLYGRGRRNPGVGQRCFPNQERLGLWSLKSGKAEWRLGPPSTPHNYKNRYLPRSYLQLACFDLPRRNERKPRNCDLRQVGAVEAHKASGIPLSCLRCELGVNLTREMHAIVPRQISFLVHDNERECCDPIYLSVLGRSLMCPQT